MRFAVPKTTPRFWNGVARRVITWGGASLVVAVVAILGFIVREALPLAGKARAGAVTARMPAGSEASAAASAAAPASAPLLAGVDERRNLGFLVLPRALVFFRLADGQAIQHLPTAFGDSARITCAAFDVQRGLLALGASDGRAALGQIDFEVTWQGTERRVTPALRWRASVRLDPLGRPLVRLVADRDADGNVAMAALVPGGGPIFACLDESGALVARRDLGPNVTGHTPTSLCLALRASLLALGTRDGTLFLWRLDPAASPELEDHLHAAKAAISALGMLLGEQSLVLGADDGEVSVWSRRRYVRAVNEGQATVDLHGEKLAPGETRIVLDRDYGQKLAHVGGLRFTTAGQPWTQVRAFPGRGAAVTGIAASPRNRCFAVADARGWVRLYHSTSARLLLELATAESKPPRSLCFAPQADGLVALAGDGRLRVWEIQNPHPEASLKSLFGRVWYEGYVAPEHVWQSTGGGDDFEPKLGLVPLLVGTFKGTLYALLFSVPIAVLAALYLSQLATPGLRNAVKPAIELMAAMPSVVVGFLAALWLAPVLQRHLAAALAAVLCVPVGLMAALAAWYLIPAGRRRRAQPGVELAFLVPFLAAAAWAGTALGPTLEGHLFGGDLLQWLYDHHGIRYDQRNCIVVGIALGFAVIPVVFTICEDAMSAVPRSLASAALALGASRWQAALHVVLPAASAGVFAAVMLGLGRATGETMIVLMATGNTPILDLSPFDGMRTMSAGIAVEIPEAPHGGTLYRVLFLTGALLFLFTFVLNTAADVVSRRLRKRYGQF